MAQSDKKPNGKYSQTINNPNPQRKSMYKFRQVSQKIARKMVLKCQAELGLSSPRELYGTCFTSEVMCDLWLMDPSPSEKVFCNHYAVFVIV